MPSPIVTDSTRRSGRIRRAPVPFYPPAPPGSLSPVSRRAGRKKARRRLQSSVRVTATAHEEEEEEEDVEDEEEEDEEDEDESVPPRRLRGDNSKSVSGLVTGQQTVAQGRDEELTSVVTITADKQDPPAKSMDLDAGSTSVPSFPAQIVANSAEEDDLVDFDTSGLLTQGLNCEKEGDESEEDVEEEKEEEVEKEEDVEKEEEDLRQRLNRLRGLPNTAREEEEHDEEEEGGKEESKGEGVDEEDDEDTDLRKRIDRLRQIVTRNEDRMEDEMVTSYSSLQEGEGLANRHSVSLQVTGPPRIPGVPQLSWAPQKI